MCYVPSPVLASVGDTGESRGAGRSAELDRAGSPPHSPPARPKAGRSVPGGAWRPLQPTELGEARGWT